MFWYTEIRPSLLIYIPPPTRRILHHTILPYTCSGITVLPTHIMFDFNFPVFPICEWATIFEVSLCFSQARTTIDQISYMHHF